jgi:uncharacterized protein
VNQRLEKLSKLVIQFYPSGDPAHDWPHVLRVVQNCSLLGEGEKINLDCLLAAAYCHDLVNLPKNHPDRSKASLMSAEKSASYLSEAQFTVEEIELVKKIVIEHSYSAGHEASNLEAAILQDADRLDALGAIGILRCASVNTQMKTSFYDFHDPFAKNRELNDKEFMLDHYFVKLFNLPGKMNTLRGKIEAEKRMQYMKAFIQKLGEEI